MIEVVVVAYYWKLHYIQMHLNQLVTQSTSLIIGFNVLEKIMDKEQV